MARKGVVSAGIVGTVALLSGCGILSPHRASGAPSTSAASHPSVQAGNQPASHVSEASPTPVPAYYLPNRLVYGKNQVTTFLTPTLAWRLAAMGVAAGSEGATLAVTTNGGHSWVPVSSTNPSGSLGLLPTGGYKDGVSFVNARVGWLTGSYPFAANARPVPLIYETRDGGRTWQRVALPIPAVEPGQSLTLTPPAFLSAKDGLLIGYLGSADRVPPPFMLLWATTDGGKSWESVPASGFGHAPGFQWDVPEPGTVIMTEAGHSWETTNFGQSWRPYRPAPSAP